MAFWTMPFALLVAFGWNGSTLGHGMHGHATTARKHSTTRSFHRTRIEAREHFVGVGSGLFSFFASHLIPRHTAIFKI